MHAHVLGKTGSGKSYFLAHLFLSLQGAGLAATLLDPHDDLAELTLAQLIAAGALDDPAVRSPGGSPSPAERGTSIGTDAGHRDDRRG